MSIPLTINGVTFQYPQEFDTHWGPTLTNWSSAVTTGMLQTSGVNAASLIKSATVNPSATGFLRLAKTDTLSWRNNLNNADLPLGINGSNQLTFNGTPIGAATTLTHNHIFVGTAGNTLGDVAMSGDATIIDTGALTIANGAITNAKIASSAGITLTKLAALTASELVVSDGSGFLASLASPSLTEIGYVTGVTSAIQTQINSINTNLNNYLPLAGGTMSGAINMGSHKITALTQGTTTNDAIAFPVGTAQVAANAITQYVTSSANPGSIGGIGTDITTVTITTTGGPVLLMGHAALIAARTSGITAPIVALTLLNGSSELTANWWGSDQWTNGTSNRPGIAVTYIDAPAAGTYTYHLSYTFLAGTITVEAYNLTAVELKK